MIRRLALPLLLSVLLVPGCGLGEGEEREGGVELRITRDFGRERLASARREGVREGDTVMRFLRSERRVETRFGGGFVQSIDGLAGTGGDGRADWFYFVNGIEASVGAAEFELSPGDVVQWDYRRWEAAMRVPAVVGAYPEPFLHGSKGKRFPVRVECEDTAGRACSEVKRRLREREVAATGATLGTSGTRNVIRVVVARWAAARSVRGARRLEGRPAQSGVFARFRGDGRTLELLDERGRVERRVGQRAGLVAATAPDEEEIVWLVTGTDTAGVEAAARLLDERQLRDAFAVAATPQGTEPVPLEAGTS